VSVYVLLVGQGIFYDVRATWSNQRRN